MTYKTTYCSEKNVSLNLERNECSLLAQFRFGILPLRIETGRYVGEKPNERLCKICDSQQIEDETHFLLHCPFYSVLRNTLFSSVEHADLDQLSDTDKTIVLMINSPRQTANYLVGAYEKLKHFYIQEISCSIHVLLHIMHKFEVTYRSIGPGASYKTFHMFCCYVYSTRHYNKQLLILSYLILSSSRGNFKILNSLLLINDFINHIHYCIRIDYYYFYLDFLILTHFLFFSYLKIRMIKIQCSIIIIKYTKNV